MAGHRGEPVLTQEEQERLQRRKQLEDPLAGYHKAHIEKGELGELSKIKEEYDEMVDAHLQGNRIMLLAEASDLYGALEAFLDKHFPGFNMDDLATMSDATKRAFHSGRRK